MAALGRVRPSRCHGRTLTLKCGLQMDAAAGDLFSPAARSVRPMPRVSSRKPLLSGCRCGTSGQRHASSAILSPVSAEAKPTPSSSAGRAARLITSNLRRHCPADTRFLPESSPRTPSSKPVSPARVPVLDSPAPSACGTRRPSTGAARAFRAVIWHGERHVLQHGASPGCQCRRDGQTGLRGCARPRAVRRSDPAGDFGGGSMRAAGFGGRAGFAGHDTSRSLSPTVRLSALVRLTARVVRGLNRASLPQTPALPSGKAPAVRTAP